MRPLILEFAETPELQNLDFSLIEYSATKNLSVLKGTEISAISYVNLDTSTMTKAGDEPTDSDSDFKLNLNHLMDTGTDTFNSSEPFDSDNDLSSLKMMMDTQTITESSEPIDSDR